MVTITEAVTAAGDHQQVSAVVPDEEMESIVRMLSSSDSEIPVASPKPKKVKSVDYRKVLVALHSLTLKMDKRFRTILLERDKQDIEMAEFINKFLHSIYKLPLHEVTR